MPGYKELIAYKKAFALSMAIYEISKNFPKEEKYSLTDQIRRSSRSVCANLAEAYRRRKYPAHFISKLSDSDSENAETGVWIEFSYSCNYINETDFKKLNDKMEEVGKLLGYMINHPEKFN
ncbi:MAG TPA: four helix bundle protein [Chitinophagaceae bacterium]|nr:four helix bundle protein [Chitinophagaceae bacterium]HPH31808.1 four helix bundle protein [Chitinophagaceae bacterium]